MKKIVYGVFIEDAANKIFVQNAIPQLLKFFEKEDELALEHNEDFTKFVIAKNGQYVRENFVDAAEHGVNQYNLDLCFVGTDADDDTYKTVYDEMLQRLSNSQLDNDKVLIFIPVQAIEYWLWYIKVKNETPTILKTPNIETENRKAMKKKVYNRIKPTNTKSNPIVEQLSKSFDINWLRQCSESFDHFANEFEKYIKNIK